MIYVGTLNIAVLYKIYSGGAQVGLAVSSAMMLTGIDLYHAHNLRFIRI